MSTQNSLRKLDEMQDRLDEGLMIERVSEPVGKGKWKFKGEVGVWRSIGGARLFFPDDGGEPMSLPQKIKGLLKKAASGAKKLLSRPKSS